MKHLIFSIFIMFFSCHSKSQEKENIMKKTYFLNYNFVANGKIYLNGILLTKMTEHGSNSANIYLNPFIDGTGKQTISIQLDEVFNQKLNSDYLKNIKLEVYFSENFSEEMDDFKLEQVHSFTLPQYSEPKTSVFHAWEFDANVGYQLPNRLGNASDFSKEDNGKLQNDVVAFYRAMHSALDTGDSYYYKIQMQKSMKMDAKSMYLTEEELKKYISKQTDRASKAKGTMLPMENYNKQIGGGIFRNTIR